METEKLLLFIPTIAGVSLTPGMCMSLAFALGLSQGYRRTLWMMAGEMTGVAIVVTATVFLLVWLQSLDPIYFNVILVVGGCYLLWIAWQLWHSHESFGGQGESRALSAPALVGLGFATAIMNPKGWAFMMALLPGFLEQEAPLGPQLGFFLVVMLSTEFLSMSLYAAGGKGLKRLLGEGSNLLILNKTVAVLMVGVALLVLLG